MMQRLIALLDWATRMDRIARRRDRENPNVFTIDKSKLPHYLKTMNEWEAEIARNNGNLDLSNRAQLESIPEEEKQAVFGRFRKVFSADGDTTKQTFLRILDKYQSLPDATSLLVSSEEELNKHVRRIHSISYAHYVYGANAKMIGTFPKKCCNLSSRNVLLGLLDEGYPMANFAESYVHNHSYNAIPFVLNQDRKGVIITDPTSDQLWPSLKANQPRNLTFVVPGERWRYISEWSSEKDMYPDGLITLSKLEGIKQSHAYKFFSYFLSHINIVQDAEREANPRDYFRRAFENPIPVKV
jgi:hypothetical protein